MRQGLALRRRSLYDRLRAIAEYDHSRRPGTFLVLVPSVWERRLTTRFCEERNLDDCYVAVESKGALERRDRHLWCKTSWVTGSSFFSLGGVVSRATPGGRRSTTSPERKRASLPNPEGMAQASPAFGLKPVREEDARPHHRPPDDPPRPPGPLARCLRGTGQPDDAEPREDLGPCRATRETWGGSLYPVRRGHTLRHPPGPRRTAHHAGRLEHGPHHRQRGTADVHVGPTASRTWGEADEARRRHHLVPLEAGGRGPWPTPDSELVWSRFPPPGPTAPTTGAGPAIAPDAVGHLLSGGPHVPFYLEHELRARHPRGVLARLRPYESYYWSPEYKDDQPPFPTTLFVLDTKEVETTYVKTAARRSRMSLPILVSCIPVLSTAGILGKSWRPLWEPESPRLPLSGLSAYQWDSLYHRMRPPSCRGR